MTKPWPTTADSPVPAASVTKKPRPSAAATWQGTRVYEDGTSIHHIGRSTAIILAAVWGTGNAGRVSLDWQGTMADRQRCATDAALTALQAQRTGSDGMQLRTSPGSSSGIAVSGRMPGLVSFASRSVALHSRTCA